MKTYTDTENCDLTSTDDPKPFEWFLWLSIILLAVTFHLFQ